MKNNIPFIDWKKNFDNVEQKHKINYDLMYCNNIEIIKNNAQAYQTAYYMDIFLEKGCLVIMLDMKEYVINSPSLILVQENQTLQFLSCSDNVSIQCCIITPPIKEKFLTNSLINISHHNKVKANHIFSLCEEDYMFFKSFFDDVKQCLSVTSTPYRIEAIFYLVRSYYYRSFKEERSVSNFNELRICDMFFTLLDEYFLTERNTDFYANRLHLSKGHFEHIVKSNTGFTPKKWLDDKLIKECKKALSETDISIGEIAEMLHFNSIGHFSIFFKRKEGVSPIDFRRKKL